MRALFVSRHDLQPKQREILEELGVNDIIHIAKQVSVEEVIELAKSMKCDIIIPVLPITMLMQLVPLAKKEGIKVWTWTMERKVISLDEVEKFKAQGLTVDVDLTSGRAVVFIPKALNEIEDIEIRTKTLWSSE